MTDVHLLLTVEGSALRGSNGGGTYISISVAVHPPCSCLYVLHMSTNPKSISEGTTLLAANTDRE